MYFDEGAVAHTFAVAAGLDSVVIGESQILGQVKNALTAAQSAGTVGTVLNALFQQALRVGKRVQAETGIGSAGRSLVSVAYRLLTDERGPLAGQRVLVVGAGAMAGLAARTAAAAGAAVTCVNRTLARAQLLADAVGGRAVPLTELGSALTTADVLVTCTGARSLTLTAADLAGTPVRGVVDLALPADVSPDVAEVGITLVNLDRLVVDQHDAASVVEIEAARRLVQAEVSDFLGVRRAAQVAPTVVALRTMASDVVAAELRRLETRLPGLDDHERERGAAHRPPDRGQAAARPDRPGPGAVHRSRGPGLRRRAAGAVRPRSPDRRRRAVPGGPPLVAAAHRPDPPGCAYVAAGPGPGRAGRRRAVRPGRAVDVRRGDHPR